MRGRVFLQILASQNAPAGPNRYINDLAQAALRAVLSCQEVFLRLFRWESCLVCRKYLSKASLESLEKLDQCVLIFITQRWLPCEVVSAKIVAAIDDVVRALAQGE